MISAWLIWVLTKMQRQFSRERIIFYTNCAGTTGHPYRAITQLLAASNGEPLVAITGGSAVKNLLAVQETQVQSLGQEDPLEKEMVIHSSVSAWRIPWTEETSRLQPIGSHTVRHN